MEALFDFREWLLALREEDGNRLPVRRDGFAKYRDDGSTVYGPFTLAIRRQILKSLEILENKVGQQLLTLAEKDVIDDIWRRDKMRESARSALMALTVDHDVSNQAVGI